MNKQELADKLATRTGLSKNKAYAGVNGLIEDIIETLRKKGSVTLVGFGTFSTKKRAARMGRNPRTRAPITIPARYAPVFKPSAEFRKMVNQ